MVGLVHFARNALRQYHIFNVFNKLNPSLSTSTVAKIGLFKSLRFPLPHVE